MCPDEYLPEDLSSTFAEEKFFDFHDYSIRGRARYIEPLQLFSFFNCLYYDLQAYILKWCDLATIGNFDTACDGRTRAKLLSSEIYPRLDLSAHTFSSIEQLRWCVRNKIGLKTIDLQLSWETRGSLRTFHFVCMNGEFLDIAMLLAQKGVQRGLCLGFINQVDLYGMSALHKCCIEGCMEAVQMLVGHGALVNLKDAIGRTPVFLACNNRHTDIATFLISEAGADVSIRCAAGKNALDVLMENVILDNEERKARESLWEVIPVMIILAVFCTFYVRGLWSLLTAISTLYYKSSY